MPARNCWQIVLINDIPEGYPSVTEGISIHWHGFSMKGAPPWLQRAQQLFGRGMSTCAADLPAEPPHAACAPSAHQC